MLLMGPRGIERGKFDLLTVTRHCRFGPVLPFEVAVEKRPTGPQTWKRLVMAETHCEARPLPPIFEWGQHRDRLRSKSTLQTWMTPAYAETMYGQICDLVQWH
jgi:hypothetical protein